jgi:hypothetical protein
MNKELESLRKEVVVAYLKYYSDICMEELRITTKTSGRTPQGEHKLELV